MISVALCTYNGEKYIAQQLDSILSQSMPVDEIIILDDCSHDSTCNILTNYTSKYAHIKVIRNDVNVGYRKNFERALVESTGDYIFFSDQDDVWNSEKVKTSVAYLEASGMLGAFTDAGLINHEGLSLGSSLFVHQNLIPYIEEGLLQRYMFEILCLKGNFVTGATLVVTREAKDVILPFRTSKGVAHDEWIALKLSSLHKLGFINQKLISYRIHPNQQLGLDFQQAQKKDYLIDCFTNNGDAKRLLKMRKGTAGIIKVCGFKRKEKEQIYRTYLMLWKRCLTKDTLSRCWQTCQFLLVELYVFLRSKTGYRLSIYK